MSGRGATIKNVDEIKQRLDNKIYRDPNSGCWIWLGFLHNGYARTSYKRHFPHTTAVYRIAYCLYRGEIPEAMEVDHLCRVRCCVNPWHMEIVTHAENTKRAIYPKETHRNGRKTHCKRGHPFDEKNTMHDGTKRQCRMCIYAKNKLARLLKKGKA